MANLITGDISGPEAQSLTTSGKITNSEESISDVSIDNGYGAPANSVALSYLGINHRGAGDPTPLNTDNVGLTFFTRPRLNLSYDNIISDRTLAPFLSDDVYSVFRIIRAYLDFEGVRDFGYASPLVDQKSAFINILTNKLVTNSGWPDPMMDTYTTKKGRMNEEQVQYDGFYKIWYSFDLDTTFRNTVGDPIGTMMALWQQYGSLIKEGWIDPRPEYIIENEMDYNTRIYRIILDPGRRFVQKIAACGAAIPVGDTSGASYNFDEKNPFNRDLDTVSVRWKCMGAIYRDPILIKEFNDVVILHNSGMSDANREQSHVKVPPALYSMFNRWPSYPRINPDNMELEWWVTRELFQSFVR